MELTISDYTKTIEGFIEISTGNETLNAGAGKYGQIKVFGGARTSGATLAAPSATQTTPFMKDWLLWGFAPFYGISRGSVFEAYLTIRKTLTGASGLLVYDADDLYAQNGYNGRNRLQYFLPRPILIAANTDLYLDYGIKNVGAASGTGIAAMGLYYGWA